MTFLSRLAAELGASTGIIREGATVLVDQASLRGDLDMLRKIVDALPNTSELFPARENYLGVGYGVKASLPDHPAEAFDLFLKWAERWPGNENGPNTFDTVEADWRRMKPPFKRGYRWLAELADRHSDGVFDIGELWFEPQHESLFPADAPAGAAETRRLTLLPFNDAADAWEDAGAEPLVKGLLDQGAMSVLYGESNSGKTFVGLAIAYAIATGQPFGGLRTTQGAVVYVSSEGGRAVRRRLAALKRKFGPAAGFFVLPETVDLFQPEADTRPLIEAIRALGVPVLFLAIDTLARAMAGGDENSTKDMSAFVKNVDRVRAATGCHLMLVHHSGKDASKGARGSSALRAATDTEIELTPGRMTATKQRDMDKSYATGFALDVVELGRDADGEAITSCTVRLIADEAGVEALGPVSAKELPVMQALETAMDGLPPAVGVPLDDIHDAMAASGHKSTKEALRHHLRALKKKGRVKQAGRGEWIVVKRGGDWFEPQDVFG